MDCNKTTKASIKNASALLMLKLKNIKDKKGKFSERQKQLQKSQIEVNTKKM